MANQLARNAGQLREAGYTASIGGVPDYAVDQSAGFRAVEQAAGSMSAKLADMAVKAGLKEAESAGLGIGEAAGNAYVQSVQYQNAPKAGDHKAQNPSRAQIYAPEHVRDAISKAAAKYGLDANTMMRVADIESSLNPNAKNPKSSAGGLFQQIDSNASEYGVRNRFDPYQSADGAARFMRDNQRYLTAKLGRAPSPGELYLAHQQGAGGALKLLANPNASAVSVVGADAVKLNGGDAGMTAGEFASLWTRKVDGKAANAATSAIAGGPQDTQIIDRPVNMLPLGLRRDGTIVGDAYDKAALSAYSWRLEAGVAQDMAAALDQFEDDPQAYAKAIGDIEQRYMKDPNIAALGGDAELSEAFQKSFAQRAIAGNQSVMNRAQKRQEAEAAASFETAFDARMGEIERQTRVASGDDADAINDAQTSRAYVMIDQALDDGLITPNQAAAKRRDVAERGGFARIQGAFERLDSPTQREQFALQLLEPQGDDSPLAAYDPQVLKSWGTTLLADARRESTQSRAVKSANDIAIKAQIDDDLTSMAATGQGLTGLNAATVAAALGPEQSASWLAKRATAQKTWLATAGMENETGADILARLERLQPKAGEAGFADRQMAFDAAQSRAKQLLEQRAKDPVQAVEQAFPAYAEEAVTVFGAGEPNAVQGLIKKRLLAQTELGIEEMAQEVLTRREAASFMAPVLNALPEQRQAQLTQMWPQIKQQFGTHAEAAMRQMLDQSGVGAALAETAANILNQDRRNTSKTGAAIDRAKQQDAAIAAFKGGQLPPSTTIMPPRGRPGAPMAAPAKTPMIERNASVKQAQSTWPAINGQSIMFLQANPNLAAEFEQVFGPGSSAAYLNLPQRENGTTTFNVDGSENWTPDQKAKP